MLALFLSCRAASCYLWGFGTRPRDPGTKKGGLGQGMHGYQSMRIVAVAAEIMASKHGKINSTALTWAHRSLLVRTLCLDHDREATQQAQHLENPV